MNKETLLFVTALMMWALAALVVIVWIYLTGRIRCLERGYEELLAIERERIDKTLMNYITMCDANERKTGRIILPASMKEEIGKALIKEAEEAGCNEL